MLRDGLFERFPCDAVFGLHNHPGLEAGQFVTGTGVRFAGGVFFDITITGRGAHGARPDLAIDPVLVACHLGTALQSIVSRNVPALDTAVLSITLIQSGSTHNVIPQSAVMAGSATVTRFAPSMGSGLSIGSGKAGAA
jgi:metal-dependent amidase/aminoacylase/carboxypeptidase family protein